jgi:hypothetical protein
MRILLTMLLPLVAFAQEQTPPAAPAQPPKNESVPLPPGVPDTAGARLEELRAKLVEAQAHAAEGARALRNNPYAFGLRCAVPLTNVPLPNASTLPTPSVMPQTNDRGQAGRFPAPSCDPTLPSAVSARPQAVPAPPQPAPAPPPENK